MSQDRNSGAAANIWGRETARLIAVSIGAELVSKNSNECVLGNDRAVIKCAKVTTDSVGVTYKMLERIEYVFGAFQTESGYFDLYKLPKVHFESKMRPTASQGASNGKVGILRKSEFEINGSHLGRITI